MTIDELTNLIGVYRAGLEAEIALLRQLERLAAVQQDATKAHDMARLSHTADERDRLMAGLVGIEHELQAIRRTLSAEKKQAAAVAGFSDVVRLHQKAGRIVETILTSDDDTLRALHDAEDARRAAATVIETGEATLMAYRRVIAPPATPSLVDKRG